MFVSSVFLCVV